MPKVMIPPLGSILELQEPWKFTLYYESRNASLAQAIGVKDDFDSYSGFGYIPWRTREKTIELPDGAQKLLKADGAAYPTCEAVMEIALPAGTVLAVDRIYIRQGLKAFNSVTFRLKECPDKVICPDKKKKGRGIRFWAKLDDVNNMVVEYLS